MSPNKSSTSKPLSSIPQNSPGMPTPPPPTSSSFGGVVCYSTSTLPPMAAPLPAYSDSPIAVLTPTSGHPSDLPAGTPPFIHASLTEVITQE